MQQSKIELAEGDFFDGVLLETYYQNGTSRPRVRPLEVFGKNISVEFPRKLREDYPIGTRFRATVKVCQKHNSNGFPYGNPYLRAETYSIEREVDFSPFRQIYAVKEGDRRYSYIDLEDSSQNNIYDEFQDEDGVQSYDDLPSSKDGILHELREKAYAQSIDELPTFASESQIRKRNGAIKRYALERSAGICEGCSEPAPFINKNGQPYLEVHHLTPVSDGGADHPRNVAAVCPNCHSRAEKSEDSEQFNESIRETILIKENQYPA